MGHAWTYRRHSGILFRIPTREACGSICRIAKGGNEGVILEIRRERMIELIQEGIHSEVIKSPIFLGLKKIDKSQPKSRKSVDFG